MDRVALCANATVDRRRVRVIRRGRVTTRVTRGAVGAREGERAGTGDGRTSGRVDRVKGDST